MTKKVSVDMETCDESILAKDRKVVHAMIIAPEQDTWRPWHHDKRWRPACGRSMRDVDTEFLDEWSLAATFCQHPGCRKIWSKMDL